jgi:hypothetical protein
MSWVTCWVSCPSRPGWRSSGAVRAGPRLGQAARGLAATARRSLREQLADRRAARRRPPPEQLRRWRAEANRAAEQLGRQRRTGAVAERRVAEGLRAWATSRDLVDRHQQREEPLAGPPRSPD